MNKPAVTLLLNPKTSEPELIVGGNEGVCLTATDREVNGSPCRVRSGESSRTHFEIVRRTPIT